MICDSLVAKAEILTEFLDLPPERPGKSQLTNNIVVVINR